ncbi:HNH endonuclease signature motif containing protein, partial [Agreia pratensis]
MFTTIPPLEPDPYVVALEEVAALDQQIAVLSAARAERVTDARNHLHQQAPTDRSTGGPVWSRARVERVELVTELAQLTRRTEYRAATLVDTSTVLVDRLPATLAAVAAGVVSWEHAEVIAKHADGLQGEALVSYDTRLAALAVEVNPKQLDRTARAQVELSQPSTAVERAEKAAATRRIYVDPAADGMAYLTLFAPAPEIHAITDRATRLAAGLRASGDPRSMGHLKLDVLTDLLLNGETSIPGATRGIRGRVHVMVPAMTLLGVGQEAAILRGYGPIDPATAAQLTAEATSWRRILTDPVTGRILTTDPRDYRPTARMIDHARLVHPTCVFPGCTVPSEQADIDHTEDHAFGGNTIPEN